MDPITTAIIVALANLGKDIIKDSYEALKAALRQKYGIDSDLVEAVKKLEERPDSEARQAAVQEEVELAKANDNSELSQLAQGLLDKLKEQPDGQQVVTQTISDVKYAATSGTGDAAISNIKES